MNTGKGGSGKRLKKERVPIEPEVAADLAFKFDCTCCHCQVPGRPWQIHHIDEDPSNNDIENLCILCLLCHDGTQVSGGFGRKLGPDVIRRFRKDWLDRIAARRVEADRLAVQNVNPTPSSRPSGETTTTSHEQGYFDPISEPTDLMNYVSSLPNSRAFIHGGVQAKLDSGCTTEMVEGTHAYIDYLTAILAKLASFYHYDTFGRADPHRYFSSLVASRYSWHRSIAEPAGPGTAGTIVRLTVIGSVASDVERMVEQMVEALVGYDETFNRKKWLAMWRLNSFSTST